MKKKQINKSIQVSRHTVFYDWWPLRHPWRQTPNPNGIMSCIIFPFFSDLWRKTNQTKKNNGKKGEGEGKREEKKKKKKRREIYVIMRKKKKKRKKGEWIDSLEILKNFSRRRYAWCREKFIIKNYKLLLMLLCMASREVKYIKRIIDFFWRHYAWRWEKIIIFY